jgi:hypothetical protein
MAARAALDGKPFVYFVYFVVRSSHAPAAPPLRCIAIGGRRH